MVAEIGASILTNIIFDVTKKVYFRAAEERLIKQNIKKYLDERIDKEFNLLLETGGIEQFFKLPQISDIINSYIIYVITGRLSDKLNEIYKQKSNSCKFIEEEDVIKYLTDCFLSHSVSVVNYDKLQVKRLFKHILYLSNSYFIDALKLDSKIEIFKINSQFMQGFNFILNKMNGYYTNILNSLKFALVEKVPNFEKMSSEYMNILKGRHKKAHIYLLDDFDLDKFYIAPSLSISGDGFGDEFLFRRVIPQSWMNMFARDNIVYVTGGAGYGKSLLMKNIIMHYDKLNVVGGQNHIVIFGELKWFIRKDGSFKSMPEYLGDCIINSTLYKTSEDFINHYLDTGRCVLLLDALDEVPMEKRKDLHQTIVAHLRSLNPNNKVCLTSRDRGFIPVDGEIEHFSIESLNAAQIEQYVDKIIKLKKFNQQDKKPFMEQAKGLVEKGFLSSFLILSLLINIYKGERELPETKLELYQKCLEFIANKREKPKVNDNFDWKLIEHLMKDNTFIKLSLLCFPNNKEAREDEIMSMLISEYSDSFSDEATLERATREFLKFCSERTELFVPANVENCYKFFHRSFFEYFYSKHIVLRSKDSEDIFEKLEQFDIDSEVFELTLARLKQETHDKYISLVKYAFDLCLSDFKAKKPAFRKFNILVLFMQVIDEATFHAKFIDMIVDNSSVINRNIKSLSNHEIIFDIISRTNAQDRIINRYRKNVYSEMLGIIKFTKKDLHHMIENHMYYNGRFLSSRTLRFYTLSMLSKYTPIEILKEISQNRDLTRSVRGVDNVNEIVNFYEASNSEDKEKINKIFARFDI